jgi:phage tail-like protein
MQVYPFWLFDAGIMGGALLFPVLDPSLAFSAITAPEITVEVKEVQSGNWEYKRQVVKAAGVAPITLSRGARFYDSDMYNWISRAIRGEEPSRRTLYLMHFLGLQSQAPAGVSAAIGATVGLASGLATGGGVAGVASGVTGAAGGAILAGFIEGRIPGRCWALHDAIPTRYKAGSDFDASASDVSIVELEVQPEYVQEVTISTLAPGVSGAVGVAKGAVDLVRAF